MRARLTPLAQKFGARMKVAEVPPGPPVLQTLVAEVYGPTQEGQLRIAREVREILRRTDGVVDVDWYVEEARPERRFVVDRDKAALHGIREEDIARAMRVASAGRRRDCCM